MSTAQLAQMQPSLKFDLCSFMARLDLNNSRGNKIILDWIKEFQDKSCAWIAKMELQNSRFMHQRTLAFCKNAEFPLEFLDWFKHRKELEFLILHGWQKDPIVFMDMNYFSGANHLNIIPLELTCGPVGPN